MIISSSGRDLIEKRVCRQWRKDLLKEKILDKGVKAIRKWELK